MSGQPLGDLELQVMEVMWKEGKMSVRQLASREEFGGRAYTTMMTTMNRLYQKGLLCRVSRKRAYIYWPSQERDEYWKQVSRELMGELMQLGGAPTLTAFVDAASEQDEENLSRLEELIQQRREARNAAPSPDAQEESP